MATFPLRWLRPRWIEMLRFLGLLLLSLASLRAAVEDPVQWTLALDSKAASPGSHILARFAATVQPGWHVYSLTTPPGPIPTTVTIADNPAVAGFKVYQPKPERIQDPSFGVTETFSNAVTLLLDVELKKDAPPGPVDITAQVRYQCCNDQKCLPPKRKTASASLTIDSSAPAAAISIPPEYSEVTQKPRTSSAAAPPPVQTAPESAPPASGLGLFLLTTFGAGLAAIFTPCVFPMIPFTVSYFVNRQSGGRRGGVIQAIVFCAGVIVFFTGLGLLVKAIAGPIGVVRLGNSPWVNSFIGLVFIAFGLSLLGAYELALPSGLLTRLNAASEGGGTLATLIMGLTFTLTSFACIGPIVGPLLVASVQTGGVQPVLGMASFATGLALPFFLLALFPSYLQKLPKSGGWLMRVKVVLGFVVLAVSLKYLSTADQIWQSNLISRELFIAAWIVLFALPGLYLLGYVRLEGIKPEDSLGVGRMLVGALFLVFSISLLPGLFGATLGDLEAVIPVQAKNVALGGRAESGPVWLKDQYREALAQARQENKLVLVNFTGNACTNCHWMKANMFPRPEIAPLLKDFVLVDLYTDGTDAVSEENAKMEEQRYQTVSLPYYVILDPDEHVIAKFDGLTRNAQEFANFLKSATSSKIAAQVQ